MKSSYVKVWLNMNVYGIEIIILLSSRFGFILINKFSGLIHKWNVGKQEMKQIKILSHFCNLIHYAENENMFFINFVIVKCT